MKTPEENLILDATKSTKETPEGFEMTPEQASQITTELSKLNDAIFHDKPISIDDLEDLSKVARGTKIDVGGEIMTVEEAEESPVLKMNMKIWDEMKNGNFENIRKLTRITPTVSKYLENIKGDIKLINLISARGLVLPQSIEGDLWFHHLASDRGLVLPKFIKGDLSLDGLKSIEGLVFPESIGGYLSIINLTSAHGLYLPKSIGDSLYLGVTSCDDLVLPKTIGRDIYVNRLNSDQKEELKKKYPQFKDKIK